jgi:ribonucleotide monophosphatase NagD (HAD superfamily)
MGLKAGMDTALALTGATDEAALAASAIQPTYVLSVLSDLLPDQASQGSRA